MKALIDGDLVCYKACFATEYSIYRIPDEGFWFRYKRECDSWIKANYDEEDYPPIEKDKIIEPLANTLHLANLIVSGLLKELDTGDYTIYLSGPKNFRNHIPYPVKYKGNRPAKPVNLEACRQYLIDHYRVVVTDGYEADDGIGIAANNDTIVVTIDKDLNMIEGHHYHMDRKERYTVTKAQGLRAFYRQLLTGDSIDSIIGIPKIGPKKAEKIIPETMMFQSDMEKATREEYKKAFGEKWYQMYKANQDLLWILRSEDELKGVSYEDTISEGEGAAITAVGEGSDSLALSQSDGS